MVLPCNPIVTAGRNADMRYLCILLVSVSAYAHDVWFEPAIAGGGIELRVRAGEPFTAEEPMAFEPGRISRIAAARGGSVRDLADDSPAMNGFLSAAEPQMISVERIPFDVTLDA